MDSKEILIKYKEAFDLLDDYDHQKISKPNGKECIYHLTYDECVSFIKSMKYINDSDVFGKEKQEGKLQAILSAVYQSAFGKPIYESIEEKAANLLYLIVKDHPFVDGCKRIAAGLFLLFLHKNNYLNNLSLSNATLASLTLLLAHSNPNEKEIMINIIINILFHNL